jgi:NAD(P)H-dependent nitrite reductase small subunit
MADEPRESRGLAFLQKTRPDAMRHLLSFFRESAQHLDPKTRFLISVVTKVISNSPRGLRQYVRRALESGATPDEVIDAVLCAYPCAGLTKVVDAIDTILESGIGGFENRDEVAEEPGLAASESASGRARTAAADARREAPAEAPAQVILDDADAGWHDVGTLDELDADRRLRVLAGRHDVAIFRVDGEVLAIGNRCPHAGGPLSEGCVVGDQVVCPLHAWRFHLRTGISPDVPGASVPTYDVRVEDRRVFVRFPG